MWVSAWTTDPGSPPSHPCDGPVTKPPLATWSRAHSLRLGEGRIHVASDLKMQHLCFVFCLVKLWTQDAFLLNSSSNSSFVLAIISSIVEIVLERSVLLLLGANALNLRMDARSRVHNDDLWGSPSAMSAHAMVFVLYRQRGWRGPRCCQELDHRPTS